MRLRRHWPFDLVHAHNASPPGAAAGAPGVPLVVSVHGGDVYFTAPRHGERRVAAVFARSALVLANSRACAPAASRWVRTTPASCTSAPTFPSPSPSTSPTRWSPSATWSPASATRTSSAALTELPRHRYVIVGDGPERGALERLAADLGVAGRVEFTGQLPPEQALARARRCAVFVMPSTDEAFGVAYVEAMAGGLPAVGRAGEAGPEEIAAAGPGMHLAGPHDLVAAIDAATDGAAARETVRRSFTWEACGRATVAAYEDVLGS